VVVISAMVTGLRAKIRKGSGRIRLQLGLDMLI
jgi:hypothetical protein